MDPEAVKAVTEAVHTILKNPDSKTAKFITKQYPPGPLFLSGDALRKQLETNLAANKELVKLVQ
jgi:tripartite-type tricarboxylate transporter receptor subunit TctC